MLDRYAWCEENREKTPPVCAYDDPRYKAGVKIYYMSLSPNGINNNKSEIIRQYEKEMKDYN